MTWFDADRFVAVRLYRDRYWARGEMENPYIDPQLDLFVDRTCMALMRSKRLISVLGVGVVCSPSVAEMLTIRRSRLVVAMLAMARIGIDR